MPVYLELTQFIEQSIHLIMIQKPHHPHSESRKVANPQTRQISKPRLRPRTPPPSMGTSQ